MDISRWKVAALSAVLVLALGSLAGGIAGCEDSREGSDGGPVRVDAGGRDSGTPPEMDSGTPVGTDAGPPVASDPLVDVINDYRISQGLPAIPFSPSLTAVAQAHVRDLAENMPNVGECNLHSWSDAGAWSACCYTPDHAEARCMWDKPRELTSYPGNGYEISASGARDPERALALWMGSSAHHDVILNRGIWESRPWGAVGAGMFGGYAVVWFGEEADPAAE